MEMAGDWGGAGEGDATPLAELDHTFLCECSFASRGERRKERGGRGLAGMSSWVRLGVTASSLRATCHGWQCNTQPRMQHLLTIQDSFCAEVLALPFLSSVVRSQSLCQDFKRAL